jgi:hypothetical protein
MSPENTHHRPSIRQPRPQQLKVSVGLSEHTPEWGSIANARFSPMKSSLQSDSPAIVQGVNSVCI